MAKKKKANDINQYEGMAYKPEISPSYTDEWQPGEFVLNKETEKQEFTGKLKSKLIGYTVEMMGYIDGERFGIIQSLTDEPMGKPELIEHFNRYQAHEYKAGAKWKPFVSRYPVGEILEYELQ